MMSSINSMSRFSSHVFKTAFELASMCVIELVPRTGLRSEPTPLAGGPGACGGWDADVGVYCDGLPTDAAVERGLGWLYPLFASLCCLAPLPSKLATDDGLGGGGGASSPSGIGSPYMAVSARSLCPVVTPPSDTPNCMFWSNACLRNGGGGGGGGGPSERWMQHT
jgi:hypothetical protein